MTVEFTKMNGAGNDFVLVDNRSGNASFTPALVARVCDRHRGVGADGLILLVPPRTAGAHFAWDFYNNDGSVAEMCGNGARCFARFVQRVAGTASPLRFDTAAGLIEAAFDGPLVSVTLTPPRQLRLGERIDLAGRTVTVSSLDTGVPHAVLFVDDLAVAPVRELGAALRHHPHFAPRGTNVNFVQVSGPNAIRVRTYERGVEDETLACGTGVTAAALLAACQFGLTSPVQVRVQGGEDLQVSFRRAGSDFSDVRLRGPADFAFQGRIEL